MPVLIVRAYYAKRMPHIVRVPTQDTIKDLLWGCMNSPMGGAHYTEG